MNSKLTTDNYKKQTVKSSFSKFGFLQRFLINNFNTVLVEELKILNPHTILDAGCGEGFILNKLQKSKVGKNLFGIDHLDTAVKLAKKEFPKLNIRLGDIYNIDSKDNTYDVVICSEVLEHLENPDEAIKELIRVSKRYVVLSVPQEPLFMIGNFLRGKNVKRLGNDIEHINHWSDKAFVEYVGQYLKVLKVITPLPWTLVIAEKYK